MVENTSRNAPKGKPKAQQSLLEEEAEIQ